MYLTVHPSMRGHADVSDGASIYLTMCPSMGGHADISEPLVSRCVILKSGPQLCLVA